MEPTPTDALTGLPNRKAFNEKLDDLLSSDKGFALLVGDIDGLIYVNDAYGHVQGDVVLKGIADILAASTSGHGYAFRTGGDEFTVILEAKADTETVVFAQAIRQKVAVLGFDYPITRVYYPPAPSVSLRYYTSLTLSLGIALYPKHGSDVNALMSSAENALQTCKSLHGDKVVVFNQNPL